MQRTKKILPTSIVAVVVVVVVVVVAAAAVAVAVAVAVAAVVAVVKKTMKYFKKTTHQTYLSCLSS